MTVQRWDWSDVSEAEAQAMADARADEAMAEVQLDNSTPRRERKVAYNGARGVPIREEVLARHGDTVITRNSYGAHCLNTPQVLFADVDFSTNPGGKLHAAAAALLLVCVMLPAWRSLRGWGIAIGVLALIMLTGPLARLLRRLGHALGESQLEQAMARLQAFVKQHPMWAVRVYRTPAGLRLLATHAPVDPLGPQAQAFFSAIGADPLYVRMCLNQRCFRARISGKPWRMGIDKHMRPPSGRLARAAGAHAPAHGMGRTLRTDRKPVRGVPLDLFNRQWRRACRDRGRRGTA